jgi:hypothetical protein
MEGMFNGRFRPQYFCEFEKNILQHSLKNIKQKILLLFFVRVALLLLGDQLQRWLGANMY